LRRQIQASLSEIFKHSGVAMPEDAAEGGLCALFRRCRDAWTAAKAQQVDLAPVLLMDEVETVLPFAEREDRRAFAAGWNQFFGEFKSAAEQRLVSFLFTDIRVEATRCNEWEGGTTNPLFGLAVEVHLQMLERADASSMLRSIASIMGVTFDEEALDVI